MSYGGFRGVLTNQAERKEISQPLSDIEFARRRMKMRFLSLVFAFLCTVTTIRAADPVPSKVTGEVLLPAGLASFEKLRLEVTLWEYDPRLADASATRFDEVVVKDYAHTKGKETRTAFTLGENVNDGQTNRGKAYYLTVFVTQGGKRTHIGEKDAKPGLCEVLTDGRPNEVTLTIRAVAEKQPVRRSKEWSGSVEDEKLAKDAPACITSAKALEKLWTGWKLTDKMPDIDFKKELVVVSTTTGSRLRLALALNDKGDLQVRGIATLDFRPGFRYVLATVSNEGVKTVNGKGLPKE
jgi:hypothetical protein